MNHLRPPSCVLAFLFVGVPSPAQDGPLALFTRPGQPVLAGPMAGRPVLADMDRDGDLDIVLACGTCCGSRPHADSGRVLVLANDGKGRFAPVDRGVVVGPSVRKVAVGDLDGDGLLDVVAAEHDTYAVHALRNAGGGRLDVAVPLLHDHRIGVLRGCGKGTLAGSREASLVVSARPGYVVTADVDADGRLDPRAEPATRGSQPSLWNASPSTVRPVTSPR